MIISIIFGSVLCTNDHQSITISTLQSLTTITQESANDERVEEDPKTIRYPDRAPCKDGYCICFMLLMNCVTLVFTINISIHKSDVCTILFNGLMHSQSAVQNKHMFVYNPDSGRSVVINASLVDVSPILILYHAVINDSKFD